MFLLFENIFYMHIIFLIGFFVWIKQILVDFSDFFCILNKVPNGSNKQNNV